MADDGHWAEREVVDFAGHSGMRTDVCGKDEPLTSRRLEPAIEKQGTETL